VLLAEVCLCSASLGKYFCGDSLYFFSHIPPSSAAWLKCFTHLDDLSTYRPLTLVIFRIPTAIRAWIEDVVVDGAARGRGVGEALTLAAVSLAKARGAKTVDLTSRQSRKAAHRLYEKSGFHVRDTSVYRFGPKPDA